MYGDATSPANQYGSQAGEAWAAGHTGSGTVYVGIIDEGYMYTHEDLAANAGTNPGEVAGNGVDDDGNGYVDDIYGWDFDGNNNSVFDGTTDDHGTHVAGTIGALGGNGIGVAGVCWNVKLLSAKFLGKRGGTTANAILAVDYFTDLKIRHGLNLVATNNSWGGGGFSQALQDAIGRANDAGILFIAAAGNDGLNTETSTSYPSGYPNANIIAVASITSSGAISSFSNYAATKVDLGAPGSAILSTVPKSVKGVIVSGYASYSGTSMATPHVTGAVALYASTHPGSTAVTIKSAILGSVVATSSLSGKCATGGRLNVSGF
jgi:subtilisin family serine protease